MTFGGSKNFREKKKQMISLTKKKIVSKMRNDLSTTLMKAGRHRNDNQKENPERPQTLKRETAHHAMGIQWTNEKNLSVNVMITTGGVSKQTPPFQIDFHDEQYSSKSPLYEIKVCTVIMLRNMRNDLIFCSNARTERSTSFHFLGTFSISFCRSNATDVTFCP